MNNNKEYNLMKRLLYYFVQSEKSPIGAREVIFYEHVKGHLNYYELGPRDKEIKVMKEVRDRYERGMGNKREAVKFYDYFYRKFRKDIQDERERQTGFPYGRKQRIRY